MNASDCEDNPPMLCSHNFIIWAEMLTQNPIENQAVWGFTCSGQKSGTRII